MKSMTFPHLLTYIVGGLTSLAALNPAIAAAIPVVGPYLVIIIPVAGAVVAAAHQFGVIGSKPATPPAA